MLISVTEKCRMQCIHCMDNALPDNNNFMSIDTFLDVIDFNLKYDCTVIITGGEPTDHPMFWKMLTLAAEKIVDIPVIITVTTNGMNFETDDGFILDTMNQLEDKVGKKILYQVTSVKGLYPHIIDTSNPIFSKDSVTIADKIQQIYPMGRALTNNLKDMYAKAPKCFNLRSLVRAYEKFDREVIFSLRAIMKFCTPQISYDGMIKLGESCLCPAVASIYDSEQTIAEKIINFKCGQCNHIVKNLSEMQRKAIGE